MSFSEVDISDMLVVPEELVIMCSEQMILLYGEEADNNFEVVLSQGDELKAAGRTPIYLCTQDMKMLFVTTVEKINKQYN
ncbi:MAG: hypothetical protein ACXV2C_00375 [Candidatus Bathyarchaeia archaeon]